MRGSGQERTWKYTGRKKKGDRVCAVKKRVEVIQQYPHHVLVRTENGVRMCITNAELRQYGIVTKRF